MTQCPDVPIPDRLAHLERDERGFPIFWAATNPDVPGDYSFRGIYAKRAFQSANDGLCQLCGTELAYWICFAGGPMSISNRVFSEPPMHRDCLEYAFAVCPFLLRGGWDRTKQKDLAAAVAIADPNGTLDKPDRWGIYVTRSYQFRVERGSILFRVAPAKQIIWKNVTRERGET